MPKYNVIAVIAFLSAIPVSACAQTPRLVWLDELDLTHITQGWGKPESGRSVEGKPMRMAGKTYQRGLGTHAPATIYFELDGRTKQFNALVGVDDETNGQGSISLEAYTGGEQVLDTGVIRSNEAPVDVEIGLEGIESLILSIGHGGDNMNYDHVDLAKARFVAAGTNPKIVPRPKEEPFILTPKPPKEPRINGPKVYGLRPGSPFLYRIPATGQRPMRFDVKDLPDGLNVAADTGIVSGRITNTRHRTYRTTLIARNEHGEDRREFRIVVGDILALTPPMGWNHWYTHYQRVTDKIMRQAADAMIESGMADVGYQYINIDDCWMNAPEHDDPKREGPLRDADGNIVPNDYFPDMKALTDYIHSKGLKAGIYTSPGPLTCGGFAGSYQHERQDARQFAEWGFDFLKYDWCSYGRIAKDNSLPELKKPYIKMGNILRDLDRDIVFNLCQYGMGDVWKWGAEVGGNCWRTAGDLGFELQNYYEVAHRNAGFHEYAGPGAWNDPDYLLLGVVGHPRGQDLQPRPCPLTPNEQYSYMSLWCLMAAPLIYTGDMSQLDEFTLNVLCNPEVIAINQDPLGKQGYPVARRDGLEIWRKELEDGSLAVGIFNLLEIENNATLRWDDLGLSGKFKIRDLWRQKDLGTFEGQFKTKLPRHAVALIALYESAGDSGDN